MKDHTAFSPDALRILTRLSRQLRQLDGIRTSLSNKEDGLWLIGRAVTDPRPEIHTIAQELFQSLKPEEQAYLESHGINFGDNTQAGDAKEGDGGAKMVRRVYRGKVFYEEMSDPDQSPADRATYPRAEDRSPRIYRGQVVD